MQKNLIDIQSKEDLLKSFIDGEKKHSDFKIGTEHEKFAFIWRRINLFHFLKKMELKLFF